LAVLMLYIETSFERAFVTYANLPEDSLLQRQRCSSRNGPY